MGKLWDSLTEAEKNQLKATFQNPARTLARIEKEQAERSFYAFVKAAWEVVEPDRGFVEGWAPRLICATVQDYFLGNLRRLVMNVPPGMMKSLLLNVFGPAWVWGPKNRPGARFIGASYSPDISIRDNRKCRSLVTSPWYQSRWGDRVRIVGDQNAKTRFDTSATGFKIATSVGGMTLGERADFFNIDDPHNLKTAESDTIREETIKWGTEIVPTRVNDPHESCQGLIMQRVHDKDLSAYYVDLGWHHVCLPMEYESDHPFLCPLDPRTADGDLLFPERYSRAYLEEILKPTLASFGGDYAISAQLQQRPVPRKGGIFKRPWFKEWDADREPDIVSTVRGWDFAGSSRKSSPWSVGVKLGMTRDRRVIVLDVVRERVEYHDLKALVRRTAELDGRACVQDLPQDPGSAGLGVAQDVVAVLHGYVAYYSTETGDKKQRALPFAAQCGAGNVFLAPGASWRDLYLAELCVFDRGPFKDQVDATSRAYARLISPTGPSLSTAAPVLVVPESLPSLF